MKLLIICGETSSNNYGVRLASALKEVNHQVYSIGDHVLAEKTEQL